MRLGLFRLTIGYVLLVLLSHLVGWRGKAELDPPSGPRVEVSEVRKDQKTAQQVSLAYLDSQEAELTRDSTAIVLLHGSPGSQNDFGSLVRELATKHRVIAPDLPGFGGSTRQVADYSIRAYAFYVAQLLNKLEIRKTHLLGFSMGGGVALELVALDSDRVKSLTLLSSIGLQEFELLGSYQINHAIHGVQLGAVWALHQFTPHFGALDGFPLNVPYARNFYDSDQRPLRAIIGQVQQPTLILHGKEDPLVPVEAALEHYRLVPQSEIKLFADNHFMLFTDGQKLAVPIIDFIGRVDYGKAATRSEASPDRQFEAARMNSVSDVQEPARGIALIILVCLIAGATLISEDLTCVAAGILVAQGRIGFLAAVMACFVGILFGDLLLYGVGRFLGNKALHRIPLKWILSPDKLRRGSDWLERKGPIVIILSRFLPGTRLGTYLSAGLLRVKFWRFVGYFALAVALWTPLVVGMSSLLGSKAYEFIAYFSHYALFGFVGAFALVWTVLRLFPRVLTFRGRRLLVGAFRRFMKWKYWPVWLFYGPVVAWIFWLGVRNRSFMAFTAVNPAMPASGFIGESKADILNGLDMTAIAKFALVGKHLSIYQRIESVQRFMTDRDLSLPIVLKPNVGERGEGVMIARTSDEIAEYCASAREDFLAQEFVGGAEFGVFYSRLPGEKRGRIFSTTRKQFPMVTGDGHTSLENLILGDERAVIFARKLFQRLGKSLASIPANGESVKVVDIGTHSLGSEFVDGAIYLSQGFEDEIDRLAHEYSGFYFGRFDIRCPSFDGKHLDQNFKILELNGVTSEATHIYDPKIGLLQAYRILFEQWSIAFEIGKANMARGVLSTPLVDLIAITFNSLGK